MIFRPFALLLFLMSAVAWSDPQFGGGLAAMCAVYGVLFWRLS